MKLLMVANIQSTRGRYRFESIDTLIKSQIENSLELGWDFNDIMLLSNFEYEFMNVKTINIDLNNFCLTGSKMFGIQYVYQNEITEDVVWTHDLDAWQNIQFDCPEFKEVGITTYSTSKYNGGSVFWKYSSLAIINEIVNILTENKEQREEPTLNKVLKSKEFSDRVTNLNNTYNVGCSGFVKRFNRSIKPIHVCHFHPYNRIAWETHALDRNGINEISITLRLERLIRKYYKHLAVELSEDGKKKATILLESGVED